MDNSTLKTYFEKFDEMPFLLTTQSYDDDDYLFLMEKAIMENKPLTREEIEKYFNGNYDVVDNQKKFKNFKKGN